MRCLVLCGALLWAATSIAGGPTPKLRRTGIANIDLGMSYDAFRRTSRLPSEAKMVRRLAGTHSGEGVKIGRALAYGYGHGAFFTVWLHRSQCERHGVRQLSQGRPCMFTFSRGKQGGSFSLSNVSVNHQLPRGVSAQSVQRALESRFGRVETRAHENGWRSAMWDFEEGGVAYRAYYRSYGPQHFRLELSQPRRFQEGRALAQWRRRNPADILRIVGY